MIGDSRASPPRLAPPRLAPPIAPGGHAEPEIARVAVETETPTPKGAGVLLSNRQRLALAMAANGLTDINIAARMGIARHTVRLTLMAARRKLGARNTTHAVALAIACGVLFVREIEPGDPAYSSQED